MNNIPLKNCKKTMLYPVEPKIRIQGNHYLVDFGSCDKPQFHQVSKDKTCSCGNPLCEAIDAVRHYLQLGGPRAPDPEDMFYCPICGAETIRDPKWDSKHARTLGWRCKKGGLAHFLEAKSEQIKNQFKKNPWLIPPAPGYPGVRRDEIITWEECESIQRLVYLNTGYDPTN